MFFNRLVVLLVLTALTLANLVYPHFTVYERSSLIMGTLICLFIAEGWKLDNE